MAKNSKVATRNTQLFRRLPSVDELLRNPALAPMAEHDGRAATLDAARAALDRLRAEIAAGRLDEPQVELAVAGLAGAVERELRRSLQPSLRPVINATGVILQHQRAQLPSRPSPPERSQSAAA